MIFNKFKKVIWNFLNFERILELKLKEHNINEMLICSSISLLDKDEHVEKNDKTILSLTTYGERINSVHIVIQNFASQTKKPNKFILWLDEEEFNEKNIPIKLKLLEKKGLEILFCKNIRSYKKIIPTLKKYPNENIITIDDDIIYPDDFIERIIYYSKINPNTVICNRAHIMGITPNGLIKPYKKWKRPSGIIEPCKLLFPTGVGGVFYPKNIFHRNVLDENSFMNLAPTADDVWLKFMTLKNGINCFMIPRSKPFHDEFLTLSDSQKNGLYINNVFKNQNDIQIANVINYLNINFE